MFPRLRLQNKDEDEDEDIIGNDHPLPIAI